MPRRRRPASRVAAKLSMRSESTGSPDFARYASERPSRRSATSSSTSIAGASSSTRRTSCHMPAWMAGFTPGAKPPRNSNICDEDPVQDRDHPSTALYHAPAAARPPGRRGRRPRRGALHERSAGGRPAIHPAAGAAGPAAAKPAAERTTAAWRAAGRGAGHLRLPPPRQGCGGHGCPRSRKNQYRGTVCTGVARAGGSDVALVANGFQLVLGALAAGWY